jgi:hypothetical protein
MNTHLIELVNEDGTVRATPLYFAGDPTLVSFTYVPQYALKVNDKKVAAMMAELLNRIESLMGTSIQRLRWKAVEHGFCDLP